MARRRAGWPCPMVKASFHWLQLSSKARCNRGPLMVLWKSWVAVMMDSWKRGLTTQHTPGAYPTAIRTFIVSDPGRDVRFWEFITPSRGRGNQAWSSGAFQDRTVREFQSEHETNFFSNAGCFPRVA